MRFVPRAQAAEQNGHHAESAGAYLSGLVRAKGFSLEGFRQRFHIALQGNVSRQLDVTREKFEAVLNALQIPEPERDVHWQEYVGTFPRTMPGIVTAGIRRHGLEKMEELSGVSRSTIYSIAHGEQHSGRKQRERHYPPLSSWIAVAATMNVDAAEAEQIWNTEMKEYLMMEKGMTDLGAEMEMVMRVADISANKWRKAKGRPSAFSDMTSRDAVTFLRLLRSGEPHSWQETETLLDAVGMPASRVQRVAMAWLAEVRSRYDIKNEELESDVPLADDDRADWVWQARTVKERTSDRDVFLTMLESLAVEGDTVYEPGSSERLAIIEYRYEHGLPMHHENDRKIEHASGTGIERGPARTFGMKF